jgi:hypothetical protein
MGEEGWEKNTWIERIERAEEKGISQAMQTSSVVKGVLP